MSGNRGTWSGLGVRKGLESFGFKGAASALNRVFPKGETNAERAQRKINAIPQISPEELIELKRLRDLNRSNDQTYGQYYNKIFTGESAPRRLRNNTYEDPTLQKIDELSRLKDAKTGGRKTTRRRRHRVRQTRRK